MPGLALPGLALPDFDNAIALPGLALPRLALPGLALPGLALPGLALPENLGHVTVTYRRSKQRLLELKMRGKRRRVAHRTAYVLSGPFDAIMTH